MYLNRFNFVLSKRNNYETQKNLTDFYFFTARISATAGAKYTNSWWGVHEDDRQKSQHPDYGYHHFQAGNGSYWKALQVALPSALSVLF